jgi:eukaryotic-like serine/threonine-protein kinase
MQVQKWKPGDKIKNGRFEILRELGEGGFGVTYLANDHVEKREVVIKTLNVEQQGKKDFPENQQRFRDEGFRLWGFNHAHIVKIYEPVKNNGLLGFVMEYIPGQDLEKYVKNRGGLNEPEALLYIDQIAQALHYVHQEDLLHRDVNPRNIMLRREPQEAVLIDFGLAREFVELEPIYLTNTYGSELYKPVEQYEKRGVFGPPTDIYALAVTLYHLLAGAPPGGGGWASASYTSIVRKKNHERGMGEECDRELWAELINVGVSARTLAAIQAGMAIEPEDRPKNMTEFRELLGLLPAIAPLPEMPPLSFSEPFATSQPLQNSPAPPVEVVPIAGNPPPGLTESIPTKAKITKDAQDSPKPVVTIANKENILPSLIASVSPPAKPTEDIKKKEEPRRSTEAQVDRRASPQPKKSAPGPNQRPSKKTSPVSRRLILQGLLGTGSLAGFSFVGLLLKNLFESQPVSKHVVQSNAAFALETIQFTTVKLDSQGKVIARPTGTAQIYKEDLGNNVIITMVRIPSGSFMMGSPSTDNEFYGNEKPQHKVNLKEDFYLGQTQVTQAQYQVIMGNNPSHFKGAELPVEKVSWLDAKEFCEKLSRKTSKTYSLTSESQWEYACRAGTTTPFSFGDTITTDITNYDGNYFYGKAQKGVYRKKTTVVMTFLSNVFGLFDMHGNVWEWCEDIWSDNYLGASLARSNKNDEDSQTFRVLRGGSWGNDPDYCRSAARIKQSAGNRDNDIGFRLVCTQSL